MGLLGLFKSVWGREAACVTAVPPASRMGRLLAECRIAFARVRIQAPASGCTDSELLRRYGSVVWGVVVEVCNSVTQPQADIVIVYSVDDAFTDDPAALVEIARWVKGLKAAGTPDPRARTLATLLNCQWQPGACVSIALDLVNGREVYVATAGWRRAGLPGGRLVDVVLPVVVLPEATGVVGVLPVSCWASELAGEWLAASAPETLGVERRIEPPSAPAWTAEEVLACYRAHPVRLTPAAASAMCAQLAIEGFGPAACVRIGFVESGCSVSYLERVTGGMEITRCEGVVLAVIARRGVLIALTGMEVDWTDEHFVFHRAQLPAEGPPIVSLPFS